VVAGRLQGEGMAHLEGGFVAVDGGGMGEQDVVHHQVGLGCGVPFSAARAVGAAPGGVLPRAEAEGGEGEGLVEGHPVLHAVAEAREAQRRVLLKGRPAGGAPRYTTRFSSDSCFPSSC